MAKCEPDRADKAAESALLSRLINAQNRRRRRCKFSAKMATNISRLGKGGIFWKFIGYLKLNFDCRTSNINNVRFHRQPEQID